MQRGSWSAGLFFPFVWAAALAEEADLTFRAAQEVRAIDQECIDVLLRPSEGNPAPVIPLKQREKATPKALKPARPDYPEPRRCIA
ncbi:MAG: hypothetical protein ACJ8DW_00040 [Microvirga sp.]